MGEWKDDLTSPLRVYSIAADDAVDLVASDVVAYAGDVPHGIVIERGSRDPSLITARPGRVLRPAVVIALPMAIGVQIDSLGSHHLRCLQAFRAACTAVENLPTPGMSLAPTDDARLADSRSHLVWSDDELDVLQSLMGREFMYEIGAFILERSNQGKARSGVALYTPQLFLGPVLDRMTRLRAAQEKESAGTDSNGTSASSSTLTLAASSGEVGAAPAESGVAPRAE